MASGVSARAQAQPQAAEHSGRGSSREPGRPLRAVGEAFPAGARRLLWLQRAAGNRAVAGEVLRQLRADLAVVDARTVQRSYLDQMKKQESVQKAVQAVVGDVQEIDDVLAAVRAYEEAPPSAAQVDTLEKLLKDLVVAARRAQKRVAHPAVVSILGDLAREATRTRIDVKRAEYLRTALDDKEFVENSDSIANARRETEAMLSRYGAQGPASPPSPIRPYTQAPLHYFIERVNGMLLKAEQARVTEISSWRYDYGDPKTGKIDWEMRGYLVAFDAIEAFLKDKPNVLRHLRPLAKSVNDATRKTTAFWTAPAARARPALDALKRELTRKEAEAGFGAPKVPLGILPAEVFLALLRGGAVLDDFGAGLQHGELSHRIQWYAIIDYMQTEGKSVPALGAYTALDLYKRINVATQRRRQTKWGEVLDAGKTAQADTYSAPGTLNRDLLEASPRFTNKGVGLAERGSAYAAPDTAGLESIGDALIELRTLRMRQARDLGGVEGRDWELYGTPTPELAAKIEQTMSAYGQWKVSEEGVSAEGKAWKVLEKVRKPPASW